MPGLVLLKAVPPFRVVAVPVQAALGRFVQLCTSARREIKTTAVYHERLPLAGRSGLVSPGPFVVSPPSAPPAESVASQQSHRNNAGIRQRWSPLPLAEPVVTAWPARLQILGLLGLVACALVLHNPASHRAIILVQPRRPSILAHPGLLPLPIVAALHICATASQHSPLPIHLSNISLGHC